MLLTLSSRMFASERVGGGGGEWIVIFASIIQVTLPIGGELWFPRNAKLNHEVWNGTTEGDVVVETIILKRL